MLCVDDNPLVADAIATRLALVGGFEWLGHRDSADHLSAAVERLEPDVILMDLDMPILGGCEATRRLRHLQRLGLLAPFPIVAATSAHEATARQECLDAGMDGFLRKPMDLALLADELHRVMPLHPVLYPRH